MYAELPHPTIFAHRGASAYAPENTLAAFELAVRQNSHAVELDVKLTADGQAVVIHDQTVDRTSGETGRVNELTLAALKTLDVGCTYDESYCGERIPTLDEVFESVGKKTFINVELTNYASPKDSLAEKTAQIVKSHQMEERVLFSSFHPLVLRKIHKLLPQVPIGLLALPRFAGGWARSFLGRWWVPYDALHPEARDVTPRLIRRTHKRGYRVNVYTVNHPEEILKFIRWGINGIITDDPPLALRTLSNFQEEKTRPR